MEEPSTQPAQKKRKVISAPTPTAFTAASVKRRLKSRRSRNEAQQEDGGGDAADPIPESAAKLRERCRKALDKQLRGVHKECPLEETDRNAIVWDLEQFVYSLSAGSREDYENFLVAVTLLDCDTCLELAKTVMNGDRREVLAKALDVPRNGFTLSSSDRERLQRTPKGGFACSTPGLVSSATRAAVRYGLIQELTKCLRVPREPSPGPDGAAAAPQAALVLTGSQVKQDLAIAALGGRVEGIIFEAFASPMCIWASQLPRGQHYRDRYFALKMNMRYTPTIAQDLWDHRNDPPTGGTMLKKIAVELDYRAMADLNKSMAARYKEIDTETKLDSILSEDGLGGWSPTEMYTCGTCGSTNTVYREQQMRGADEPMTVFIRCSQGGCGYAWTI